jgi:ABC-type branched-subunit amino acid transport system permease subunit
MATLWWAAAAVLTVAGALLFWGARVLEVESFYVDASILLFLALLLAGLSHV